MSGFDDRILALARRLVRLDPRRGQKFMTRLLRELAEVFETDRVSLFLLDLRKREFTRASYCGFKIPGDRFNDSNLVSLQVIETAAPVISGNIGEEYPELAGPYSESYKTQAFASFPMIIGESVIGIISVSNLQSVGDIINALPIIEILVGIITQIISVLELPEEESPRSAARQIRAIREFTLELEKLDKPDALVQAFADAVFREYDVVGLVVMGDALSKEKIAWLAPAMDVSLVEVRSVFASVAREWQMRTESEIPMDFSEARVTDPDRLLEASDTSFTKSIKIFPVVLDQQLFAVVGVALESEVKFSEDQLDLFNLLTFQFGVSLKNQFLHAHSLSRGEQDRLTGLNTREHFEKLFCKEFDRCKRYSVQLGLLVIDIDHFKDLNETYGRAEGDLLLQEIGHIIVKNSRSCDVICRIGDDKFGVLLPETSMKQAEMQAERLRKFVANFSFYSCEYKLFKKATVSIGIASFKDHKPESTDQLMEFADTALYFAKRNGRNKIMSYSFVLNLLLKEGGGMT